MKKILLTIGTILAAFLLLPLYVELFESPAGKEGWYFTMFLTINPVVAGLLGILSGTDPKRLWFAPIAATVAFPLGFWLTTLQIDTDLLVYTPIYLGVSLIAMLISHLIVDRNGKEKNHEAQKHTTL